MSYIDDMKGEAQSRRDQADAVDDPGLKRWLLTRAAYFDQCAVEAEASGRYKDDEKE